MNKQYAWTSDQSFNAPDSNLFSKMLAPYDNNYQNNNNQNNNNDQNDQDSQNDQDNTQNSRDDNSTRFNSHKSNNTNSNFPRYDYDTSLRAMLETAIEPTILNEYISLDIYGRSLPIGFAEYVDDTITPLNYNYYFIPGWRVAIPRVIPMNQVSNILNTIFYKGPEPAGFVRIGDTLVPAMLDSGERMALAYAT